MAQKGSKREVEYSRHDCEIIHNAQGELSPLEIGLHALNAVELSSGGAGKTGGISEYSRCIGKGRQQIIQLRDAANVFKRCQLPDTFSDKATHLYEVSRAPEETWSQLCEAIEAGVLNTVDDVSKAVARVKAIDTHAKQAQSEKLCGEATVVSKPIRRR